jgi:hypothetical protein
MNTTSEYSVLDRVIINDVDDVLTVISVKCTVDGWRYDLATSEQLYKDIFEEDITFINTTKTHSKYDLLKMYVLVRDSAPIGLGINGCTHVGYLAGKTFNGPIMKDWEEKSFRKVTCLVSDADFYNAIKAIKEVNGNYVIFRENDWDDKELSVAFEPRYSFPEIFKTLNLHSGRHLLPTDKIT